MSATCKSYFSGAGGMDLGLQEAGIYVVESFELDAKCCDTLDQLGHKDAATSESEVQHERA